MDDKKKLLVLFGGKSSEHDVSCVSAKSVLCNVPTDKYEIITIGITKEGNWFRYSGSYDKLPEDKWLDDPAELSPAFVSPDPTVGGIVEESGITEVDVVFPVLHGKNGEDGTVQALLQLAEIPFVGCDMLSSAVCMDKAVTNSLADRVGIKQAKWLSITQYDYRKSPQPFLENAVAQLGTPIFVKPANAGSSVGISKVKDLNELADALETAFAYDEKVVLEECIVGQEIECAVLGNEEPTVSVPGEIAPSNEFYDFDAKYVSGSSGLYIPAHISEEMQAEVRKQAVRAYKAMGCSGFSRVDFFVTADDEIYLNEINTIPGFTSISMYPKLFEYGGVPYPELIDRLITFAIQKHEGQNE